jgi:hypothetical protein
MSDMLNLIASVLQIFFVLIGAAFVVTGGLLFGAKRIAKQKQQRQLETSMNTCKCHRNAI